MWGATMAKWYKDSKGYPRFSDSGKLVHKWVAEKKVGGKIYGNRVVHHKDENKSNYSRDNLQVMDRGAHSSHHAKKRGWW